nr:hypothetical protein [Streptomyces sp. 846.5]
MGADTHRTAAAHAAAAQLTALTGTDPRTIHDPDWIRVEIDVTAALRDQWTQLLPVFDMCDRFGLKDAATGQTLWLHFALLAGPHPTATAADPRPAAATITRPRTEESTMADHRIDAIARGTILYVLEAHALSAAEGHPHCARCTRFYAELVPGGPAVDPADRQRQYGRARVDEDHQGVYQDARRHIAGPDHPGPGRPGPVAVPSAGRQS